MRYKPHEYVCIVAWGRRMGSFNYYITAEQKRAAEEGAPITAIYRNNDGTWSTAEEIKDPIHRKNILGSMYIVGEHGQYGTEYDVTDDRWDRLPRVCAAFEFTYQKPILLHRGHAGYTELSKDFDVDKFNSQRRISSWQVEAMLAGSMFGWEVPGADPFNVPDDDVLTSSDVEKFRVSVEGCLPDLVEYGDDGEERFLDRDVVRDYVGGRAMDCWPHFPAVERTRAIDYVTDYYCGKEDSNG